MASKDLDIIALDKALRWEDLVTRYYELRGWDAKTGRPARAKLEALGMKKVADKLRA